MILKRPTVLAVSKAEKLEEIRVLIERLAKYNCCDYETFVNYKDKHVLLKLHKYGWTIAHIFSLVDFGKLVDTKAALSFQVDKLNKQLEAKR